MAITGRERPPRQDGRSSEEHAGDQNDDQLPPQTTPF